MKILKKAKCGNLSNPGMKTLTYNVGNRDDEYYLRVTDNEGGGFFSTEWITLSDVTAEMPSDGSSTTAVLTPLYESKSSNNPGFLAAVLVAEKLWSPVIGNRRQFTTGDVPAFAKRMQPLISKKTNLKDEVAEQEAKKETARIALEKKLKAQRTRASKAKS